ncbi:hypothetical protein P691DRAFT_791026 [Macrolepiota fuliginosa MF-IS2]|uniref:Zinc finger CHCC-type domain-containing protein n=1 Tax=Macrolepiota fuliginosa MF-IS2 TaxID=1400762 RepID=A0A9P5XNI4_9AGAR|nr:hypothetical protein P691DRAFT_791026 [Macrolepiota fuliginosa MF-IS2]
MLSRRAVPQLARSLRRAASTAPAKKNVATPAQPKEGVPVVQQASNYPTTWSTNQQPRPGPGSSPRFEQTNMELQPNPLSAMKLIADEPVRVVNGRKAVCDGGGGPLGHPKIYINLDQPGPRACGYVGKTQSACQLPLLW